MTDPRARAVSLWRFLAAPMMLAFLGAGCVQGHDAGLAPPTVGAVPPKQPTAMTVPSRSAEATVSVSAQVARGQAAEVVKVVDGDTIQVRVGGRLQAVRYIGIDTPETKHPRVGMECYGREAAAANRKMVEGHKVTLEKDFSETDRYGRLLRYVWIGETMVNDRLVRMGFAVASAYPPDVRHQSRFRASERAARKADAGLWGSCGGADTPAKDGPARGEGDDSATLGPGTASRPQDSRSDPSSPGFTVPACARSDCDCSDFGGDSDWATWFLRTHDPGDPHRLDGDRDGMACE